MFGMADADHYTMVSWKTFPERLEENGISWKIYQNDIGAPGIYSDDEDVWLSNFGDNPIEYFTQFNVKLSQRYIDYLQKALKTLPGEINDLESKLQSATGDDAEQLKKNIEDKKATLSRVEQEQKIFSREKYDQLSPHEKALHEKAFTSNKGAPFFYELESLQYDDGGVQREVQVPKGDIFYQFRKM
jgi:phospholipase C